MWPFFIIYFPALYIDNSHVIRYISRVIKSFADKLTRELFLTGKTRKVHPDVAKKAVRRMGYLENATCLNDLKVPPSNRLHALSGERQGQYSISVNDQWRVCFRFENGDAYDIEFTDYH